VVRAEDAASPEEHPRTAVLVIEISGESLRLDRGIKAAIHAPAGIPEYWIFDIEGQRVETRSDPDPASSRYLSSATLERTATLQSKALPGLSVPLASLFS
jgi:Uma2 family endonuclease